MSTKRSEVGVVDLAGAGGNLRPRVRIRPDELVIYIILAVLALISLYPVFVMFASSFKTQLDIFMHPFALPSKISLANYLTAWSQAQIGTYFINSATISASTVALIVFIASMAAYVFARFEFPGKQFLFLLLLAGLVLPGRLALVPQFILVRNLGLLDHRTALVLIYTAGAMPFSIFILTNYLRTIPHEIEESAVIDGASVWIRYSRIMLPLSRPGLATIAVFNLVGVWNDFFLPLIILRTPAKMTIPVGLTVFFGEYTVQWNLLFAALALASLPMIILFLLMTRQFIRGLTAGALKA